MPWSLEFQYEVRPWEGLTYRCLEEDGDDTDAAKVYSDDDGEDDVQLGYLHMNDQANQPWPGVWYGHITVIVLCLSALYPVNGLQLLSLVHFFHRRRQWSQRLDFHSISMSFLHECFVFGPVLLVWSYWKCHAQDAAIRFLKAVGVDFERHKAEGLEGKLLGALLKGSDTGPYEGIDGKGMNTGGNMLDYDPRLWWERDEY